MAASTFQQSGGVVILHSKDLVNWKTVGCAIENVAALGPEFNWDRMGNYGGGVFAPSLHYHDGKFRVFVNCYRGEGFWTATAEHPSGPWEVRQLEDKHGRPLRTEPWTDPDAFWDDDGQAYLATAYLGTHSLYLFRMSTDGTRLLDADLDDLPGSGTVFYRIEGTEGNKIFKRNGYYYLFNVDFQSRSPAGRGGYMKRARHLYGTKEDGTPGGPGDAGRYEVLFLGHQFPSQGGFVDTPEGDWYFLGQYDDGGAAGRRVHLVPVHWLNDWPLLGEVENGMPKGEMVWRHPKPAQGYPVQTPQGSDDFVSPKLSPIWHWNHQPREGFWSLSERPGYLRLRAFRPLRSGDFFSVGNILAQRYLLSRAAQADIRIDLAGMRDGQEAGLAHFNGGTDYSSIAVVREKGRLRMKREENGRSVFGAELPEGHSSLWLRTTVNASVTAAFYFSLDGIRFEPLGDEYALRWGGYRGDNIGIYTCNDRSEEGFVDIDWFRYVHSGPQPKGETFVETNDLSLGRSETAEIAVRLSDGSGRFQRVPSSELRFESRDPTVASVDPGGRVTAQGEGETEITVFEKERSFTVKLRIRT